MADDQSPDVRWLLERIPDATDDEKDDFCEWVARGIYCSEDKARDWALKMLRGK